MTIERPASWSYAEIALLRELAKNKTSAREIGLKLGKTEEVVRAKAKELDIFLYPAK